MAKTRTIGQHLIERLEQTSLRHIFGIPGDYVLGLYDLLVASRIEVIGTCTEIVAGFAAADAYADAYARVNGLDAVCVTYCVGGLNVLNAVAGAYAEKSPLIVISGAPGLGERRRSPLLHHQVRDFNTQHQIYEKVTCASCALEDADDAASEIDRVLDACQRAKRPVYIEVPRDMVDAPCRITASRLRRPSADEQDRAALKEAAADAAQMLRAARRPVILAGVEIHRFQLQERLLKLVECTGLPVAATLLGKSVIRENHAQYIGIYEGAMGKQSTQSAVERADCLLILGAFMSDINLGVYTARLDVTRTINANSARISIKWHHYDDLSLALFIDELTRRMPAAKPGRKRVRKTAEAPFKIRPRRAVTVQRLFDRINEFLDENTMVICDIGDSLFGAADLTIHGRTEFLSPAYLLHLDGIRGAGRGRRPDRQPRCAAPRIRRRRSVPDDRSRAGHRGPARAEPDRDRHEQQGVHHRANDPRGAVQRHPRLGLPPAAPDRPHGMGLRSSHGGRTGGSPDHGAHQHTIVFHPQPAPGPERPLQGAGATGETVASAVGRDKKIKSNVKHCACRVPSAEWGRSDRLETISTCHVPLDSRHPTRRIRQSTLGTCDNDP